MRKLWLHTEKLWLLAVALALTILIAGTSHAKNQKIEKADLTPAATATIYIGQTAATDTGAMTQGVVQTARNINPLNVNLITTAKEISSASAIAKKTDKNDKEIYVVYNWHKSGLTTDDRTVIVANSHEAMGSLSEVAAFNTWTGTRWEAHSRHGPFQDLTHT